VYFFKEKRWECAGITAAVGAFTLGLSTQLCFHFWVLATCRDGLLSQRLEDHCPYNFQLHQSEHMSFF
jgi:hypothetical protein